jgi:large subunit ribosomal protein L3
MDNNKVQLSEFIGVKVGMTRIFDTNGNHIPVTVIKLIPNIISQVKTNDKDGYNAYQIAYGEKRESLISEPKKGQLKKANIDQFLNKFSEIKTGEAVIENLGKEIGISEFTPKTYIDVTGLNKGKGFQGVMKRHGFQGGPAAHGSHFHRRPGSIGCRATPARVFAEKKLPGQMGCETVTVQNLQVVEINSNDGYMLIKGSVPGGKNSYLRISKAIKK